ncbi:predicted protein [Streptomyces filamentosus NRRL 15998]|uniref:Predicted protein n=1 Tax=Streptomyces filamentosus NRRL 15998 TaxID=457431 RepID=D6AHI0_STRFL|nr:predicted protein [Streptomyces filamentosus NRRL 15998]
MRKATYRHDAGFPVWVDAMPLREFPGTTWAIFDGRSGVGRSRIARVRWHSGRRPGASLPPRRIALITAPGYLSRTPPRHELLVYKRTH